MKGNHIAASVRPALAAACLLLAGCGGGARGADEAARTITVEETARLRPGDDASPSCTLAIDYQYLPEDAPDGAARRINAAAREALLGPEYGGLAPEEAVDSFRHAYVARYRRDVGDLYEEDLRRATPADEMPTWYDHAYCLTVRLAQGREGVVNLCAETSEYTGGAHPHTWDRWMNFDAADGRRLTREEVFLDGSEAPLCRLLLRELVAEMAARTDDEDIRSAEDLRRNGVLTTGDLYVPDDFLLEKDRVSFLYNRYDIAPYAMGAITLSLTYDEAEPYLAR